MRWEKDYTSQRELDKLLDFLIVISKEKDWVHMVLATTDCCFAGWLAGSRFQSFYLHSFKSLHRKTVLVTLILICFRREIGLEQVIRNGSWKSA